MRREKPPCDACLVTRGSGAAFSGATFLFMPDVACAISAGASSTDAISAGASSADAISAGASSGVSDATSPGAATSAPTSTAGSTSITACVEWGWRS